MRWKQPSKQGVQTLSELAEIFLKRLGQLSVLEQLKNRKVIQIVKRPLLCCGALTISESKTGLVIFLSHKYEMSQWLKTMGHEIGHSFFFKQQNKLITRTCRRSNTEEDFCDIFSQRWIETGNNAHETEALLEKHFLNSEKWSYIEL